MMKKPQNEQDEGSCRLNAGVTGSARLPKAKPTTTNTTSSCFAMHTHNLEPSRKSQKSHGIDATRHQYLTRKFCLPIFRATTSQLGALVRKLTSEILWWLRRRLRYHF